MKRSELEKHIGESVEVKLFDGDTMQGVLRKTGTEEVRNNPNLYLKGGYYFLSHKDTYVCKSCLKCGQISLSCAYMAKHKGCGGYYTVDFATKIYRERAKEKELA